MPVEPFARTYFAASLGQFDTEPQSRAIHRVARARSGRAIPFDVSACAAHDALVDQVLGRVRGYLLQADPGGVLGAYLYGSAAAGRLRPDSDIDVLVVVQRSLSERARQGLLEFCLAFSGRRATVSAGRPIEVTALVLEDVVPWRYPPTCDFLYGEWLRDEFTTGRLPQPHLNPDLAILITTVLQHATCLQGPPPSDLLVPVPRAHVRKSISDSVVPLLDDLLGDERNVLLTLARMVVTLETGQIVPKDVAARQILPSLAEPHRSLLCLAARGYVGDVSERWQDLRWEAASAARYLAGRIRTQ